MRLSEHFARLQDAPVIQTTVSIGNRFLSGGEDGAEGESGVDPARLSKALSSDRYKRKSRPTNSSQSSGINTPPSAQGADIMEGALEGVVTEALLSLAMSLKMSPNSPEFIAAVRTWCSSDDRGGA